MSLKISVIIPVRNGGGTLEHCLSSLRSQTIGNDIEIIILDSMSTDDSVSISIKYNAKIVQIPILEFDHGLTRNIGVRHAKSDLLYFTVQDARIPDEDMLERMIIHFRNQHVVAVMGHQVIPHELDKNPLKWYKRFNEPVAFLRQLANVGEFQNLDQKSQQSIIAWDNVVAMYRRKALLELPFISTKMSEDWVWSRDALLKGWKLMYDPSLLVYHYHHETYRYVYELYYSVNYHFYKYFGFVPGIPAVLPLMARATWHLSKNKKLTFSKKIYWIFHNYKSIIAKLHSHLNFLFYLKTSGLKGLSKRYSTVCKTIPQGKQNRIS